MRNLITFVACAFVLAACNSNSGNPPSWTPDPNVTKHCSTDETTNVETCICLNATGGDVACPN